MPGIDVSLSEQQAYYDDLLKQYKRESENFNFYKDMCKFDLDRLESDLSNSNSGSSCSKTSSNNEATAMDSAAATEATTTTPDLASSASSQQQKI